MKSEPQFKELLKALNRDPRLKRALTKQRSRAKDGGPIEEAANIVLALWRIASGFTTRKKARTIDELLDALYVLLQVSLLLKENVFDRPDVQRFFKQRSKRIYSLAQGYLAMVLPRPKELPPARKTRSA